MKRVHTHYDNLKVSRDAPSEVIRAAYRSLAQKYHPDRNPDNAQAARAMSLINAAYEVLSDPAAKADHDLWIMSSEAASETEAQRPPDGNDATSRPYRDTKSPPSSPPPPPQPSGPTLVSRLFSFVSFLLTYGWIAVIIVLALVWNNETSPPRVTEPSAPRISETRAPRVSETRAPSPAKPSPWEVPAHTLQADAPSYTPPMLAPNGASWPRSAGYVSDYPELRKGGLSTVTVDNSRNTAPVFAKLFSIDGQRDVAVRYFYIPGGQRFTLDAVQAGRYDVRYRTLEDGRHSKTEPFQLTQTERYDGTEYSTLTLTLYKVVNGNMRTTQISADQF